MVLSDKNPLLFYASTSTSANGWIIDHLFLFISQGQSGLVHPYSDTKRISRNALAHRYLLNHSTPFSFSLPVVHGSPIVHGGRPERDLVSPLTKSNARSPILVRVASRTDEKGDFRSDQKTEKVIPLRW